jgi:hypothetical protein
MRWQKGSDGLTCAIVLLKGGALGDEVLLCERHVVEGLHVNILVIGEDDGNVGPRVTGHYSKETKAYGVCCIEKM